MKSAMTQTQAELKLFTFDEFIEWYPENLQVRYELHNGVIVEMPKPTGTHFIRCKQTSIRKLATVLCYPI